MKWLQCRVCQRTTPLSRASRWVEEWSSGHVRWLCPRCRAGLGTASERPEVSAEAPTAAARREYFVDPFGLIRTRRVSS